MSSLFSKKFLFSLGILIAGAAVFFSEPTQVYAQYYYINPQFSLNRSGDIYPGTALQASGSVSNSSYYPYSGSVSSSYQVRYGDGGGWSDFASAGSFSNLGAWQTKSVNSYDWNAGSAGNTKYYFRLCSTASDGRHCTGSTWVRVVNLPPPSYSISVSAGTGGTAACSGCGSSVTQGSSVTAGANANSGYQFSSWSWSGSSNPCSSAGSSCTFSASQSGTLTANFNRVTYSLSVSRNGSGYVSGGGIDCGNTCSVSLSQGASVSLSASPSSGWVFGGWSGCDSTSGRSCSLTMNSSRSVSASFTQLVASASLSASSPVSYNSGTYLTWSSSNTNSCTLTNFGSVPTNNSGTGYYTGNLTSDSTFTLSCSAISGAAGTPTDSKTIAVKPSSPSVSASTGSCGGIVNLSYDSASLASSYRLYRDSGSGFSQIASASTISGLPSSQSGLSQGVTYRYQLEAANSAGSAWSSVSTASASGSCFDYSLSNSGNLTITQGGSGSATITATLTNGSAQSVTLSASGLPSEVTASFSTNPVSPTGTSQLTLSASGSAAPGTYSITVTGAPLGKTTSFSFNINSTVSGPASGGSVSLASDAVIFTQSGTWTVPPDVVKVRIHAWGGGGAGGNGQFYDVGLQTYAGAGGGGGGYGRGEFSVTPNASHAVIVGSGGSGHVRTGQNEQGGNGNPSSVGALLTAYGGTGGFGAYGQYANTPPPGGAGGGASAPFITSGQNGGTPSFFWANGYYLPKGGDGGAGGLGGTGGRGGTSNNPSGVLYDADAGSPPGGGGGGSALGGEGSFKPGASGKVAIEILERMQPPATPTCRLSYRCEIDRNVSAIPYHYSNTLTWSAVSGASGYRVYRSKGDNLHYEKVAEIIDPTLTIWEDRESGYKAIEGYLSFNAYYKATAFNAAGESGACAELYQEGEGDACPFGPNPDLTCPSPVVVSGTTLGDGFKSGDPLTLSGASIKNDFRKTTISPINSIYQVSKDGGTTYQDIAGSVKSVTGGLTIGESKPVPSYQYSTPLITGGGDQTLYFRAKVDHDNRVTPEASEDNNFCPASPTPAKIKELKPDLTAALKSITGPTKPPYRTNPTTPEQGSVYYFYRDGTAKATVSGLVRNEGDAATVSGFSNHIKNLTTGTEISGSALTMSALNAKTPAADAPANYSFGISLTTVGTTKVALCADSASQIAEGNGTNSGEANNCSVSVDIVVERKLRPEVKLYISPTGVCGTANSAQIIKGSPARLCWSTTPVEL